MLAIGCRRKCTNFVSRSRFSRRNSDAPNWRCVACRRRVRDSSARSPAKRRRSTSTDNSASSCATARCWTPEPDRCTTCGWRQRQALVTSTASRRSLSSSGPPARRVSLRSPEFRAASKPHFVCPTTAVLCTAHCDLFHAFRLRLATFSEDSPQFHVNFFPKKKPHLSETGEKTTLIITRLFHKNNK